MSFGRLTITYPDGKTAAIELTKRQMVLGRASDADVPINDTQVSRRHALLLCGPEGVRYVDAGSANGTYLASSRLPAQQPVPLPDGAQLRVGQTLIRFTAVEDAGDDDDDELPAPSATDSANFETNIKGPVVVPAAPSGAPPAFVPPAPPAAVEHEAPRRPMPPPGVPTGQSSYLKYLPPVYANDDFIGRFLLIFESILSPVSRTIDNLPHYLDPRLTPPELLPWLAAWIGLALDERWPEAQRRALIRAAVELYEWRGTRRGLSEFLRLYTGHTPEIIETGVGRQKASEDTAFRMVVRLKVPDVAAVDRTVVETIIDLEKPAHVGYSLEITEA